MYLYNIENLPEKYWFDPNMFTRQVDVEKYLNYQMSPATLMDGFSGEGFGLTDKDAESVSYKRIAQIQKMLGGFANNLQILGQQNLN